MAITKSKELKKLKSKEVEAALAAFAVVVVDTVELESITPSDPTPPLVDNIILISRTIVEPYTTHTANLLSHCFTIFNGPNIQKSTITAPKTIDHM